MSARIVLLGPPGAGKGTQAARLAQELGVEAISTGDIFRANIKGGTELGRLAQEYTAKGELVPDSVTNAMVKDKLTSMVGRTPPGSASSWTVTPGTLLKLQSLTTFLRKSVSQLMVQWNLLPTTTLSSNVS